MSVSSLISSLCISSYTFSDSLQNRFVPFQFAIIFYQIVDFHLEPTIDFQSYTFNLKTLLIKENQKLRAISYTRRLNKHQSAICVPLYQRRSSKHWTFNQPFEIKAQNQRYPWERRPQNYSGTGRDPITNCEKENESFWGYKEEVKKPWKTVPCLNYYEANISGTREGFFSQVLFVTKLRYRLNDKSVLWLSCVTNIIKKLCLP